MALPFSPGLDPQNSRHSVWTVSLMTASSPEETVKNAIPAHSDGDRIASQRWMGGRQEWLEDVALILRNLEYDRTFISGSHVQVAALCENLIDLSATDATNPRPDLFEPA